jgi:hypothetical protein
VSYTAFLNSLKDAATSPYAFLGYLAVVSAWVYLARSHHRLTVLARAINDLPKNKRADLLFKEYNTSPAQALDPEQWIRTRLQMLWFAAFLAILAVIAAVTLAALIRSPAPVKTAEITPLQPPIVDRTEDSNPVGGQTPVVIQESLSETPMNKVGAEASASEEIQGPTVSVKQILEGSGISSSHKIYDVTLSNNSRKQILLKSFDLRWGYYHGVLSSVGHGEILKPIAEYVVKIPIDTDIDFPRERLQSGLASLEKLSLEDYPQKLQQTIYPSIVLPPRNESGPSLTTIRLEVQYYFAGRIDWHPCSDWDIFFDLGILHDGGPRLPLLRNRAWRELGIRQ